jgi:hypothetical protein
VRDNTRAKYLVAGPLYMRESSIFQESYSKGLPEPIDLELDLYNHMLYWTDRGDPPRGNTVNRANLTL